MGGCPARLLGPPRRACSRWRCCSSSASASCWAAPARDRPSTASVEASTGSAHQQDCRRRRPRRPPVGPVAARRDGARPTRQVPLLPPSGECARRRGQRACRRCPGPGARSRSRIRLGLQRLQPACTFKVSPQTLVVKITSRQRPASGRARTARRPSRRRDVVVRSGDPDLRRRGLERPPRPTTSCSRRTAPGRCPGFYHVYAAALGSAPTDVQFELTRAPDARRAQDRAAHAAAAGRRPSTAAPSRAARSPRRRPRPTPRQHHRPARGRSAAGDNAAR